MNQDDTAPPAISPAMAARLGRTLLVALDIDGTLLRRDGTISDRTRAALAAAAAAELPIILATGRPPRTLIPVAERVGLGGMALASNGAIVFDLDRRVIAEHMPIPPATVRQVVMALRAALPELCFGWESELRHGAEPAYERLHNTAPQPDRWLADALDLADVPLTKLLALHPTLADDALLAAVRAVVGDAVNCTHSGLPFVEISAAGIDKAAGLALLCRQRGVPQAATVAAGDMPIDLPMLAWAGVGVAVANAHPDVLARAALILPRNDDDGVALLLETMMHHRP
jgi:Cof subfamily protein (haloacid dehalogenase superfamily)